MSFITEHWRGSRERSQTFRLGAHHGLFCVGCCWSLMLLMFLVGVTVADLFSGAEYYVNVHAVEPGSGSMPDAILCGELRDTGGGR